MEERWTWFTTVSYTHLLIKRSEEFNELCEILIDIFGCFIYNQLCGVKGDFFEMEFTMDFETKRWMF